MNQDAYMYTNSCNRTNKEQGTCTYILGLKGQDPWEEQTVHSRHCQGWWYSIEHEEKYMTKCKLYMYNDNCRMCGQAGGQLL